jgi:hypothetical protein
MKPKLLTWNVRGLNEGNKRSRVKNLLRKWKADIVCLRETKLKCISNRIIRSLWGCHYANWCCVPSIGALGGILLMWDKRVVKKVEAYTGEFVAAVFFRNVDDDFVWAFAGDYGPNFDVDRRYLWEVLAGLTSWWDVPWCIGGDFNVTRFPSERSRNARISHAMSDFSDFISDQGLMELPLAGGTSTWTNNISWSRLDRFIVFPEWEAKYLDLLQKRLLRVCSDHFPIDCGCIQERGGGGGTVQNREYVAERCWFCGSSEMLVAVLSFHRLSWLYPRPQAEGSQV